MWNAQYDQKLDFLVATEYPDLPKFLPLSNVHWKHAASRNRHQISEIH